MLQVGAKFTPCMRRDFSIESRNMQRRNMEVDLGYGLGCCRNGNTSWVGTATLPPPEHANLTALAPTCSSDDQFIRDRICNATNERNSVNFRPCCISITGECRIMNTQECERRGGIFHLELDNCNQTNCLNSICGLNGVGSLDNDPVRPAGNQGYRLILALFTHVGKCWKFLTEINYVCSPAGAIHVVIILVLQLYLGIKIERAAGFLRVAIIYILSGVGGYLVNS